MATITLHSFGELAEALHLPPPMNSDPPDQDDEANEPDAAAPPDVAALLAALRDADNALRAAAQQDATARDAAFAALERYEAADARRQEAAAALDLARQVAADARSQAERAFTDDARRAADRVASEAGRAAAVAADWLREREGEVAALAATLDVPRLAAMRERQRRQAAEMAAAEERANRLAAGTARVRAHLAAGRPAQAEAALAPLLAEAPDDRDLQSLAAEVQARVARRRTAAAEAALPVAFPALRRQPEAAVRRLERLEVDGLPEALARRVFGAWAEGCARLCRERGVADPLRYAPDPGRGLVLIPDGADGYTVLSAFGCGDRYPAGSPAPASLVRRARPLRPARTREG